MGTAWLDGGVTHYHLCLHPAPALALLRMRRDSYLFQDKIKQEIITELLLEHLQLRFDFDLTRALAKRAICIQYRDNDVAFLPCLLVQKDLGFHVKH